MSTSYRLSSGGRIDRKRPLHFTFDGRELSGFEGDTVASALLACGVAVVGRSMKFHRPRGVLSAGVEEPNALVTLGGGASHEPSARATVEPLVDGLVVKSQNAWPSLGFDLGRVNDALHRLFPAGFYNKTFLWPGWHAFEPAIRRMAGLGTAPDRADPDRYEWRNAHCDVLVAGGGVAGLLAASMIARSGARVILVESDREFGGRWNWERESEDGTSAHTRLKQAVAQLGELPHLRRLLRTTAVGLYDHGVVTAIEKIPGDRTCMQRWWRIRARHVVVATGAFEQPLVFAFNDRPGIMLADAVRHYANRYAVAVGRRVVVATNNDSAYRVAFDLRAVGVDVPCILDTREKHDAALGAVARQLGIDVHQGVRIAGTFGNKRLTAVQFSSRHGDSERIRCDVLAMSGGWNPAAHLYCQAGGRLRYEEDLGCLVPDGKLSSVSAIGSAAAQFDPHSCMEHVRTVVDSVLARLDFKPSSYRPRWAEYPQAPPFGRNGPADCSTAPALDRAWVDFQHDVTAADVALAIRENLVSVEHVKRYTTLGMSVDQGKTSNLNGLALLAAGTQRSVTDVGTTTFRPPFVPVTLGAIAGARRGRDYRPMRLMPAHRDHVGLGARFEDYAGWQRPACYPQAGERLSDAIHREARGVRSGAGLFDSSPLGKLIVRGPDAAEFLDRMYANTMRTLEPGRVRYGLMLNERGAIIDDGVCARLAPEEFWVNTTSGGAAKIAARFEEWSQTEWPALRIAITDATSAWATLTLAGPRAREVLASLPCDIDLTRAAFPHMHARLGHLCGAPCRILRVSFSGELSYEISVPADFGAALWSRLMQAGQPHGLIPYGVETVLLLRTEKGYLHVGSETDGTTVPDDVGFGTAVARKKGDFIGRRSLQLPQNTRADRLQLVGLRCDGPADAFISGAHLLDAPRVSQSATSAGYLTSACLSPTLGSHVGLALLSNGRARSGETVHVVDHGRQSRAIVVPPAHYDPSGARLDD